MKKYKAKIVIAATIDVIIFAKNEDSALEKAWFKNKIFSSIFLLKKKNISDIEDVISVKLINL